MGRTNVVIDDELIGTVMRLYGLRTKREAVDFALRRAATTRQSRHAELLALRELIGGEHWARHFEAIRHHPVSE